MQEGYCVQHWLPLVEVGDVQLFLGNASVGSLQACLHPLWRLIGELDAGLKWNKLFGISTNTYVYICTIFLQTTLHATFEIERGFFEM